MMKTHIITFCTALLLTLPAVAQTGGVAVLDIDEVAKQLGVEEKVRIDLLNLQNNLNADLQKAQATMQNQMNVVQKAAGENPTDEQKRQVLGTKNQLNEDLNRIKAKAQQSITQERVRMISEFRSRIEPIALKAAKAINMEVVLMKVVPPVFAYDARVDITQETIRLALEAGMQAQPSTLNPPITPETTGGGSGVPPAVGTGADSPAGARKK